MSEFGEYIVHGELGQREKAYAWQTAIGLQDVDGLKVSDYLLDTARQHIEEDITIDEVQHRIKAYNETEPGHDAVDEEGDKASANIAATISDAKEITPDPVVGHTEKKKGGKKVVTKPHTRLRITMPDGSVIEKKTAWESLHKFVLTVGVYKVRAVGLKANKIPLVKIPLVSNTEDKKYRTVQKPLVNGWLLMTCSDTATKRKQILTIASRLGFSVLVDIV